MRPFIRTVILGSLVLSSACQAAKTADWAPDAPTAATLDVPHAGSPASAVTGTSPASDSMPVFVEVTQRTTMSGPRAQQPRLQVGVAGFRFSPDTGVLWVPPSIIEASLAADMLIGESTVLLTPGQSFENRELVQFPAGQPILFRILALDPDTEIVRLSHDGESYELPRGKSLRFERVGGAASTPTVITIIVNHGRLAAIQSASPDGSVR